jgi:hypothetical protein
VIIPLAAKCADCLSYPLEIMHTPAQKSTRKMIVKIGYLDVAIGHQTRTAHHVHDTRPRRQRTRKAAAIAAMQE